MKKKIFPLPPGMWFAVICVGIVVFFVLLKPADRMEVKREPRQTIKEATAASQEKKQLAEAKKEEPVQQEEAVPVQCIARVDFYGDASAEAKFDDGLIVMESNGKSRWTYALVQFAKPIDFFTSTITFLAKGEGQAQAMEVGLTDVNRRTTAQDEHIRLALSDEYQKMSIRGKDIQSISLNKGKVSALKIAWQSPAGEEPVDESCSLYIKDVTCVSNQEYLDAEEKTAENQSLLEPDN